VSQRRTRSTISSFSLGKVVTRMAYCICLILIRLQPAIASDWIDEDTPEIFRTTTSFIDGTTYHLVMSDEFNVPNRTFADGDDPMWTALDKPDDDMSSAGGGSLHFYNSSTVTTTADGMMKIASVFKKTEWDRFDHVNKSYKHETRHFQSGMVQGWNKFCFTGGIVEVDVIMPGDPFIGGLWPAVWLLGNLGRATYEASTNNIWPWSYDVCDRKLQEAQEISKCNAQNHYGLNPHQGRGATEVDIVEVMTGDSNGPLPATVPPITLPYGDMTLQVAPGIPSNRPNSGKQPKRNTTLSDTGHTMFAAETWYDGLELQGNTSVNPFFYGTYLGETKPEEPVTRTKEQAFQADAVGSLHQLTRSHFEKPHTFRVEWQPGKGGRLDWFVKTYFEVINGTLTSIERDGKGHKWVKAFTIKDKSLSDLIGSQIPNEPSSLIFNTAISSTWGFPYDVPAYCKKCYDCDDPKCACSFYPGFCNMIKSNKTAMYIDSVRVYQSRYGGNHVGNNHSVGCDVPEYPSRDYIKGNEYKYARAPPFSTSDHGRPLQKIKNGGAKCKADSDCGGNVPAASSDNETSTARKLTSAPFGRGRCIPVGQRPRGLANTNGAKNVCSCTPGYTGPHCLAIDHIDDFPSAMANRLSKSLLDDFAHLKPTRFMIGMFGSLLLGLLIFLVHHAMNMRKREINSSMIETTPLVKPQFIMNDNSNTIVTGRSV